MPNAPLANSSRACCRASSLSCRFRASSSRLIFSSEVSVKVAQFVGPDSFTQRCPLMTSSNRAPEFSQHRKNSPSVLLISLHFPLVSVHTGHSFVQDVGAALFAMLPPFPFE